MALRRTRTRLPDDVRSRLDLVRGDKVLASGGTTDGWVVASRTHLHVVEGDGAARRYAWHEVDGARLDPETTALHLTWVNGRPPTVLHLVDDRSADLPRAVHERVQSSVVHRGAVRLPSGSVVRVVARRDDGGGLVTQVIGAGDVDLTDPATADLVDAAEARVREAVGLV